jgi:FtsH-binding integral membrane protein
MNYPRFLAMIATSTLVMFGLMYLNTYLVSHVFWSETRAYMAVLMGATMAIVMLAFMFSMYPSRKVNAAILAGAAVIFGGGALAGPKPGDRGRHVVHAGDDPAPFDRHHDVEPRGHL